tara:strand:- start:175 stop:459 length:285 start_codon:yes stop_codon:yes gene_type:complete
MAIFFILITVIICLVAMIPLSFFIHYKRYEKQIAVIVKNKDKYGMDQKWRCVKCSGIMLTNYRLTLIKKKPYAICNICAQNSICIDKEYITEEP